MKSDPLDYKTYLQLSSNKFKHFLKNEDITKVKLKIKISDKSSFSQNYQDNYTSIPGARYYTLKDILSEALPNSEEHFKQYKINPNRVKELVKWIFIEDFWLTKDIVVGNLEGKSYLIGGRHRAFAIAHMFALLANKEEESNKQSTFEEYLKQSIRVNYMDIKNINYLLPLLIRDNDSRRMMRPELSHLKVQSMGADADGIESISKIVLDTEKPKDVIEVAGQNFTRRTHKSIKPRALQLYGQYLAKWILYGLRPEDKLSKKKTININTTEEFDIGMDKAWNILVEIAEEKDVKINTGAFQVSQRIVERLIQENSEESKELVAAE